MFLVLSGLSAGALGQAAPATDWDGLDVEHWFRVVADTTEAEWGGLEGRRLAFEVDLENSPGFSVDFAPATGRATLLYRMAFNNIAEGWSWQPQADPEREDYYRYKFLPLKSVSEEKALPARVEIYPGKWTEVKNVWRYDYFMAFDNLYQFYPRQVNDDAGFAANFAFEGTTMPDKGNLAMLAVMRLKPPCHAESNTFWKADFADPVDYTLRKRYLLGDLLELRFYQRDSGKELARLTPLAP